MTDDFVICNSIRQRREALGLTQTDFGELVGLSKNSVSSIELFHFYPSLDTVFRLLDFFYCSFDDLFFCCTRSYANSYLRGFDYES